VIDLTKSVALELGEFGIRVNCLCPGFIATPIVAGGLDLPSQLLDKVPDVAALWLASDAAEWVTGHALVVDGGVMTRTSWSSVLAPLRDELRALASEG